MDLQEIRCRRSCVIHLSYCVHCHDHPVRFQALSGPYSPGTHTVGWIYMLPLGGGANIKVRR